MCQAVPGKIVRINENADASGDSSLTRTGSVSFGGVVKEDSLAYVPEAKIGDYVIVHVGFALSIVDEKEAEITLQYLQEMQV
jgi:hydrogenase expression/formation protein HypC